MGRPSTFVRANLPAARDVRFSQGRPVALLGDVALGAFTLPRLAVTDVSPEDGAGQVPPSAQVTVSFSRPLEAATVTEQTVLLRAQDAVLGPLVPATVTVQETRILVAPRAPLPTNTELFLTVLPTVHGRGWRGAGRALRLALPHESGGWRGSARSRMYSRPRARWTAAPG